MRGLLQRVRPQADTAGCLTPDLCKTTLSTRRVCRSSRTSRHDGHCRRRVFVSLARLVAWGRRNAGAFAAIAVASVAAVGALAAIVAGPRATTAQAIVPRQVWPWW